MKPRQLVGVRSTRRSQGVTSAAEDIVQEISSRSSHEWMIRKSADKNRRSLDSLRRAGSNRSQGVEKESNGNLNRADSHGVRREAMLQGTHNKTETDLQPLREGWDYSFSNQAGGKSMGTSKMDGSKRTESSAFELREGPKEGGGYDIGDLGLLVF
mmetsp:Transcript_38250/g.59693  ORF Transcript_38250/g.59693 Transcript_38250/m.59693 type:complete len:156 (+) Transcript_38250:393-860(+)